jgi:hypothetical protein
MRVRATVNLDHDLPERAPIGGSGVAMLLDAPALVIAVTAVRIDIPLLTRSAAAPL